MNREDCDKPKADDTPKQPDKDPAPAPITPGEEPSALERGARILERLRRRPPE